MRLRRLPFTLFAVGFLGFTLSGVAQAQCRPRTTAWPTAEWPEALVEPAQRAAELVALEDFAFTLTGAPEERKGYRTNALLVIRNGAIVYERYARGWDRSKRQLSWSVAKSLSSAMIGAAVHQGFISSLDDSVCQYLKEYQGDPVICPITVKHFLTFASGLQWQEEYENEGYQVSSVIAMLFGVGHKNQVRHVLTHRKLVDPGSRFRYSTGDAHVVSTIAKRAFAPQGPDALWTTFFDRVGMSTLTLEEDVAGNVLGGSFAYATPRDYAKFGYLFLNDGCWNNERLLPIGWVTASTTTSPAFVSNRGDCSGAQSPPGTYQLPCEDTPNGYMWWLNRPPAPGLEKPWKDAPDDTFAALGHWGQYILVIPSEDTVIVRFGDDREKTLPVNDLVKLVLPVVRP